jgi:hypothetical protein
MRIEAANTVTSPDCEGGIGLDKRASPSKLSAFVRYHFDAIEARNIELI